MTLQIWDTAGQERFRSMAPMYYRNAKAAILVFDVTNAATFEKIKEWLHDLRQHVAPDIVLAVVGNKCDCATSFEFNAAMQFAQEIGAMVFRTSAKTGEGVTTVFESVGEELLKKHEVEMKSRLRETSAMENGARRTVSRLDHDHINISREPSRGGSKCC